MRKFSRFVPDHNRVPDFQWQTAKKLPRETEKILEATSTIVALLRVVKSFSLYPQDHPNSAQALATFHESLLSFLAKYGPLQIGISGGQLICEGVVVDARSDDDEKFAFTLFRDGLKSLEFVDGVSLWELGEFARLLDTYKQLPDDPEDDLVTALWEAELPHVRHETAEYIPDDVLETGNPATLEEQESTPQPEQILPPEEDRPPGEDENTTVLHSDLVDSKCLEPLPSVITSQEYEILESMIRRAEASSPAERVLPILLDILLHPEDKELFPLAIDFLSEQIHRALSEQQFDLAIKTLTGLHDFQRMHTKQGSWPERKIAQLFLRVSGRDNLDVLNKHWSNPNCPSLEQIKRILLLLPPSTVSILGPMLVDSANARSRRLLSDVITEMATKDILPLEDLLRGANDELLEPLVSILGRVDGSRPVQLLINLSHHRSERIRSVVLTTLIRKEVWLPDQLLHLVRDPSPPIRRMFLKYLGSKRCETAERLMIDVLAKARTQGFDNDLYLSWVQTLGRCGSGYAVVFLCGILFRGSFVSKFFCSRLRRIAALSLRELGTPEALETLRRAAQSPYSGIRRAAHEALGYS